MPPSVRRGMLENAVLQIVESADFLGYGGSGTILIYNYQLVAQPPPVAITTFPVITNANVNNVTVAGTGNPGDTISVAVSDNHGHVVTGAGTVHNDGGWSVGSLNASSLVAGNVTYTVTQSDVAGDSTDTKTATDAVTTVTQPTPPTVSSAANQAASLGVAQAIDLGSFSDPDSGPWQVDVNWGDNSADATFTTNSPGSLDTQPHTYAGAGNLTVTVTVTNSANQTGSATFLVSVSGIVQTPPVNARGSTPEQSKKGLTAINVAFDAALETASAEDSSDYHVFGPVTKVVKHRRETLYTKPIRIASVSYDSSTDTANVKLAKPVKGKVEIQVSGTFTTTAGTQETVNYTNTL